MTNYEFTFHPETLGYLRWTVEQPYECGGNFMQWNENTLIPYLYVPIEQRFAGTPTSIAFSKWPMSFHSHTKMIENNDFFSSGDIKSYILTCAFHGDSRFELLVTRQGIHSIYIELEVVLQHMWNPNPLVKDIMRGEFVEGVHFQFRSWQSLTMQIPILSSRFELTPRTKDEIERRIKNVKNISISF